MSTLAANPPAAGQAEHWQVTAPTAAHSHGADAHAAPVKSPVSRKEESKEEDDDTHKQNGDNTHKHDPDNGALETDGGQKKDVGAEETGSPQGYIEFVKKLTKVWVDNPEVLVSWKDLSYRLSIDKNETAVHNVFGTFVNAFKGPINSLTGHGHYTLNALQPSSGMILPGSTTLVLAPPGHGQCRQHASSEATVCYG